MALIDDILGRNVEPIITDDKTPETNDTVVLGANEGVTGGVESKFIVLANTKTAETVQAITNQTILNLVQGNEDVKAKIDENAKTEIDNILETQNAETVQKKTNTRFKGNESACKIYGVEKTVPLWQQKMMTIGAGFWFVIYFIFASVTVAPVSTFATKLNVVFKHTWFAIVCSVLIYLFFAVGLPLLLNLVN